jgi:hypothetical protein
LVVLRFNFGCLTGSSPYRDKKVVGVFVAFRTPLQCTVEHR